MAGVTLDASVLIALGRRADAHHVWAQVLFDMYAGRPKNASIITMAEVLVGPTREGQIHEAMDITARMGIEILPLSAADVVGLASLRAASKLRMPDAVVLHTAITQGTALATTDRALATAAREAGIETHSPE